MSALLITSYSLFSIFLFYQQLHLRNFQGSSQGLVSFLSLCAGTATIFGIAFLGYHGYKVSWPQSLVLFGVALGIRIIWFPVEAMLGLRGATPYISISGLLVIPACAYFMWSAIPH